MFVNELPHIFKESEELKPPLQGSIEKSSPWLEFVLHLSHFSGEVADTRNVLQGLLKSEPSADLALLNSGLARCDIREGRFLDAAGRLASAWAQANGSDSNTHGFVALEMVNLLSIIGNRDSARAMLGDIEKYCDSEYLLQLQKYYSFVNSARSGNLSILPKLQESLHFFKQHNYPVTVAFHYKNIGNIYGKQKDFQQAEFAYQSGINIAKKEQLSHIVDAIDHDRALMNFRRGDSDFALKLLGQISRRCDSHYTEALSQGNMGFIHIKLGNTKKGRKFFEHTLQISQDAGVFHLIPSSSYYIAKISEKEGDFAWAKKHYELGYESSMQLVAKNFPLKGERRLVVNSYVEFLNKWASMQLDTSDSVFSFSVGKSWKEIQDIFQSNYLDFALKNEGNVKRVVKKLNFSERSYGKVRERIAKRKLAHKLPALENFLRLHYALSWKEMNRKFEDETLQFLLAENDMSKKRCAENLGMSYPYFIKRFKEITIRKGK